MILMILILGCSYYQNYEVHDEVVIETSSNIKPWIPTNLMLGVCVFLLIDTVDVLFDS